MYSPRVHGMFLPCRDYQSPPPTDIIFCTRNCVRQVLWDHRDFKLRVSAFRQLTVKHRKVTKWSSKGPHEHLKEETAMAWDGWEICTEQVGFKEGLWGLGRILIRRPERAFQAESGEEAIGLPNLNIYTNNKVHMLSNTNYMRQTAEQGVIISPITLFGDNYSWHWKEELTWQMEQLVQPKH